MYKRQDYKALPLCMHVFIESFTESKSTMAAWSATHFTMGCWINQTGPSSLGPGLGSLGSPGITGISCGFSPKISHVIFCAPLRDFLQDSQQDCLQDLQQDFLLDLLRDFPQISHGMSQAILRRFPTEREASPTEFPMGSLAGSSAGALLILPKPSQRVLLHGFLIP